MMLSIIIANYNYGEYVAAAIDSALAIEWQDKEIIVVDDGSTDASPAVIRGYGDRISAVFLSNGGQSSACNVGFERSRGDIIIFLDSDDIVLPTVAGVLRAAWSDRLSKLQWSLTLTDASLRPLGRVYPAYRTTPTPDWIRHTLARTGHYPYSLGGAWPRKFLKEVFPVPVRQGTHQGGANGDYRTPVIDHYLSMLAPFFGDVACIPHDDPQGIYRIHSNNSHLGAEDPERYPYASMEPFDCADQVNRILSRSQIVHLPINVEYDESTMMRQLICRRLNLEPRRYATRFAALWRYWRSVQRSDAPAPRKLIWYIWSIVVIATPRPISLWAIHQRRQGP
jgi:glycosyltransferase involved in cell wall biosynthesis